MDLEHDYEHEHEKATSDLGVERLPNFELLLTPNDISVGIAA
jgi:hypothetical protein